MFSHFVTAAKGLFTRSESQENITDPAGASAATTSEMVTSTRKEYAASKNAPGEPSTNGVKKQGKRKAPSDEQQTKRRKQNSLKTAESDDEEADSPKIAAAAEKKSSDSEPKKHFRFGSEELSVPETQPEDIPQASNHDDYDDSDSDDDAPETIDNSAQLLKMKQQAKKQEQLKKLEEQVKKEKRRKIDERRKLQAKPKTKEIAPSDETSESTATLQGSNTQDARRAALPALLPDDILNAEPVLRPPTPPAEDSVLHKKPNKLRFLDKTEKAPKDVQVGDLTIRVLDAPSVKKNSKPALAPKASKTGRNVKDNWLKRQQSTGHVNGLRRTAGGLSGFVRR